MISTTASIVAQREALRLYLAWVRMGGAARTTATGMLVWHRGQPQR